MELNRQLLARVWRPVQKKLNRMIERSCLRRDAYLDHVFAHEAKMLKEEILCPNSRDARDYLQGQLEELDRAPINFSLSPSTIKAITEACDELNVIRDCFINRVLFLLASDINLCELIIGVDFREELPEILGDHDRDYLYAPLWGGSLSAISEIVCSDPFWALRNIIDHRLEQGDEFVDPLHRRVILPELFSKKPPGVIALNCHLPDEYIPGSRAAQRAHEQLDELLGELTPKNPSCSKPKIHAQRTKAK